MRPMQPRRNRTSWLAVVCVAALGVTACATSQTATSTAPVAAKGPTPPRDRVTLAIGLLLQGKPADARAHLVQTLKEQPTNDMAKKLLAEIDTDPKLLLGDKSYPYRARKGDTASALAEQFLGDPLMFYALARYNDIDPPSQSLEGRLVMIPGQPKVAPARPAAPQARPAPGPAATAPAPAPSSAPGVKPGATAGPHRDSALANGLRAQALVQMNQGAIDRAVALLNQAVAADPANPVIKRDLDRALRVQHTVQSR